jgi:nucleoside-diphosphate-sugar epimerase
VDCLFHAAAENTTRIRDRDRVLRNTEGLTEVVLNTARTNNVPVVVYTSSVVVLGRSPDPSQLFDETTTALYPGQPEGFESPYVEGKVRAEALCERYIRDYGTDIRRMYPSWLVGPSDLRGTPPQRTIANFVAKGQRFWIEGGISIASVVEVAHAHVEAFERGEIKGRYVLAGENVTFRQFYNLLSEYAKRTSPKWKLPKVALLAAASVATPLFRLIGKDFPVTPGYVRAIVGRYSWYSSAKAKQELQYRIIPAAELLEASVLDGYRRNLGLIELGRSRAASSPRLQSAPPLLITGVPGWLGNRMLDILVNGDRSGRFASDRPVRLLVEPRFRGFLQLPANFEIHYGDICDAEAVRRALKGVSSVFHLAGVIYPPHIKTLYRVNHEGTRALVDACVEMGVRRVIYMGTDSICGHGCRSKRVFDEHAASTPYRHYGRSKFMGENYVMQRTKEGAIDGTSLRGFWFFGPFAPARQRGFAGMFHWPRQLVFGNGRNLRSISHVDDIIAAFFQAENCIESIGKWYWICSKTPYTVDQIYTAIADAMNVRYRPFHLPVALCRCINLMDWIMGRFGRLHPTIHAAGKFYFDIAGDATAAQRDFSFDPRMQLGDAAREFACEFSVKAP